MARRPLTVDERKARARMLVFAGTLLVIGVLVIAAVAVFGSFLSRFGGV